MKRGRRRICLSLLAALCWLTAAAQRDSLAYRLTPFVKGGSRLLGWSVDEDASSVNYVNEGVIPAAEVKAASTAELAERSRALIQAFLDREEAQA